MAGSVDDQQSGDFEIVVFHVLKIVKAQFRFIRELSYSFIHSLTRHLFMDLPVILYHGNSIPQFYLNHGSFLFHGFDGHIGSANLLRDSTRFTVLDIRPPKFV